MAHKLLDDQLHWYKDAIIYELHIKAFRDSNGDGIGDFAGLMQKLDYIQELGVTAIWLLPFYPSPLRDDGYDIADYYTINPRYGTMDEFRLFLEEAHKRNLKVITELVINHTSDQHPWFQRARTAPKGSPERDFYVWSDDPSKYKDVRIIFQDFESSNWTWDPVAGQYYWHRFFHHQPDLNYDNQQVQEEIFRIIDYWCAMGVDGFRLDAVPYLYEREGTNGENLPETHAFLKRLRAHIDERYPKTVFLAEANMWPEDSASYFGDGDECHMNYHFPVMPRMFMALQQEDRYPITDIFDQTPAIPETCQWAMFLRNHDELTLEMVTDEERDFMYKAYAKDPKARINLGIRHRLAPLMDNNRRKIELMNSLLFSLPGTPVIYYGDEIGMGDNFYLGDRDGVRTPMQWSADRNAGFSEANPHRLYLPVILDPEYHYESLNVEMQRRNTSSLFWYMKAIINMRKSFKAFSRGDMHFLLVENPKVLAFTRTYEEETMLVVVNLSKYAQPAEIDLRAYNGFTPVEVLSKNRFPAVREGQPYFLTMGPHSYQWYRLEKTVATQDRDRTIPALQSGVDDLQSQTLLMELETKVLPSYLPGRKWFTGTYRDIYSIKITDRFTLDDERGKIVFLLVEVQYASGLPDVYQLAITKASGAVLHELQEQHPDAVIAHVAGNGAAALCDAFYIPWVQDKLFRIVAGNEPQTCSNGSMQCHCDPRMQAYAAEHAQVQSKMHLRNEHNTSITYDGKYFLKMYRKVEAYMNPDVELSRFLSEQGQFTHIPEFIGLLEWRSGKGDFVLAMMQEMVENHGDGHSFMLERAHNFIERVLAAGPASLDPEKRFGSFSDPLPLDALPESLQVLLGGRAAEQVRQMGVRIGELHKALATGAYEKDFIPEEFSLHYQRSLFSSMQSLVRESFHAMERFPATKSALTADAIQRLAGSRQEILQLFKRVYRKKLSVLKIRNHGSLGLKQVLFTGRDMVIHDFGGNAVKSYSERRLKRSPLRDVAQMIFALHYVAFEAFTTNNHIANQGLDRFLPFLSQWAFYMSGIFTHAYLETVAGSGFVPEEKEDREMLLQTFIMERALKNISLDIVQAPQQAIIPLIVLQAILKPVGERKGALPVS